MKRFEHFGEYMFDLLFAPLKKGRQTLNQFFIFFRVVGREFDDLKQMFFRVRDEANVASASEVMLPVHGQDRDMPRLLGEDIEHYRTRLAMKGIISEWGGTRRGILYALTALGYELSRLKPMYQRDPERWAEFIVWLKGEKPSSVYNLKVIDDEICKIKEGSSLPAYGMESGNRLVFRSRLECGLSDYPRCGQLVCGVWPSLAATGYLLESGISIHHQTESGTVQFPRAGTITASEKCYHYDNQILYAGFESEIVLNSAACEIEEGKRADK